MSMAQQEPRRAGEVDELMSLQAVHGTLKAIRPGHRGFHSFPVIPSPFPSSGHSCLFPFWAMPPRSWAVHPRNMIHVPQGFMQQIHNSRQRGREDEGGRRAVLPWDGCDEKGGQLLAPKKLDISLKEKPDRAAKGEGRMGSYPSLWEPDSRVRVTANQHHCLHHPPGRYQS